ncbi:MAG TPA: GNAT family N-acetyltransferase [Pyrinomonadaceae bacterium]|nr:GNAT family N-acetyltransferase [Pyrinomonadaceae bacterium]
MKILETERLILSEVTENDAEFMLDLLNQPSFIKYIGDRNVRTIEEAKDFIKTRYQKSYDDNGYGLYLVELKSDIKTPNSQIEDTLAHARVSAFESKKSKIGICGFVKRDNFQYADIGFAFLPQFEKHGYAFESAQAVMGYGEKTFGFKEVLAITTQDNESSGRLLEKLHFKFNKLIEMPNGEVLKLFSWEA